ncbi:glutamate receptor 3.4-like [Camellia sinensis]|uniref:glutamate receptor 3.4-like n=1 Tax=Camellia sinensis TaxID=4442 RepID=UPI001035A4BE|nr:glutamate receptor 3.4-like [Camellia sinensis]
MKVMGRTGNASVSSSKPNVVNIGALYNFNSVIERSSKPGIEAAVDDVNSDSTVLGGMKLNLILHDTNCSGFLGTVEGILERLSSCGGLVDCYSMTLRER